MGFVLSDLNFSPTWTPLPLTYSLVARLTRGWVLIPRCPPENFHPIKPAQGQVLSPCSGLSHPPAYETLESPPQSYTIQNHPSSSDAKPPFLTVTSFLSSTLPLRRYECFSLFPADDFYGKSDSLLLKVFDPPPPSPRDLPLP